MVQRCEWAGNDPLYSPIMTKNGGCRSTMTAASSKCFAWKALKQG